MAEPFLGEIRLTGFPFAPKGWALCNGQFMSIAQNQALFAILGTTYGGDGRTTFALPDLRGRVPLHAGSQFTLGQRGGEEAHTLTVAELPAHTHGAVASSNSADQASPVNNFWANGNQNAYASSPNVGMSQRTTTPTGGQPHENRPPYLVVNFIIALQGIFPSHN